MYQGIVAIKDKQWYVDIATTYQEVTQGLGGVASIPEDTGMLFDLGYSQSVNITTYPMLFPIDIAFISNEFVITQIERNVPPGELIYPDSQVRLWLEVNANELEDIEVGDGVSIEVLAAPILQPSYLTYIIPIMVIGMMGAIGVSFAKAITAPPPSKAIAIPPTKAIMIPQDERSKTSKVKEAEYFTDTEDGIESSMFHFQTQLDDVFVEAIKRARKLYE